MDQIDRKILAILQNDAGASVADIADRAGISSTPAWRRIKRMEEAGIIDKKVTLLDPAAIGLGLTGFVMIRTSKHSEAWLETFAKAVAVIPEIVEVHRTSGDIDYVLKIVAPDIAGYDKIYKKLIGLVEMTNVSATFSMEQLKFTTELPLGYAD